MLIRLWDVERETEEEWLTRLLRLLETEEYRVARLHTLNLDIVLPEEMRT